jgi:hypothetical protein
LLSQECGTGEFSERFMVPQAIIVRTVTGAIPPPEGHIGAAGDELPAGQVAYYRRRAGEYGVTAYGDLDAARARITRLLTSRTSAQRSPATTLQLVKTPEHAETPRLASAGQRHLRSDSDACDELRVRNAPAHFS